MAANNLSDRYLWGPAVDQLLADEQLVPAVGGYDLTSPGTTVWTLTDNENTVRDLATYNPTTQTTTVVNHREFSAYGELLSQTNPQTGQAAAVDCVFAYTGRALDEATGLQNNGERWYEAITGRWLSQDPIGFGGGINLYEYVGDAPLRGVDPTGEDVYIQSTRAANGWHWQICVDTWGDGCSRENGKVLHIVRGQPRSLVRLMRDDLSLRRRRTGVAAGDGTEYDAGRFSYQPSRQGPSLPKYESCGQGNRADAAHVRGGRANPDLARFIGRGSRQLCRNRTERLQLP